MAPQPSRRITAQTAFGLIFIFSVLLFLLLYPAASRIAMNPSGHPTSPFGSIEIGTVLAAATTLITATASLIGLISTVILSWRRDVREARQAALQQQLTELQIEKERAALKGSSRKK